MLDTGMNVQESMATLLEQQRQLIRGKRTVQMFPKNTFELALPDGFARWENERGTFHYNPQLITAIEIQRASKTGRENEFLLLGPYSKQDVAAKLSGGEQYFVITEYTLDGVEVRTAVGCDSTVDEQVRYFEATKDPENVIAKVAPDRIRKALGA